MPKLTPSTTYCTILARNYLPKAVTLAGSLERHHPGSKLVVLVIDARNDEELPELPPDVTGVTLVGTDVLGLPVSEVLHLAVVYNLVEFATAIKPLLLKSLLEKTEQAAYLDPDTYVTSPMIELPRDLAASPGGILLTPHFLKPVEAGAELSEGHLLTVGVYNLGFCAVDRRAVPFLDWWWGHLEAECLFDPLSGLFVDQKWVDIGAVLFHATSWQHPGYNVSIGNLHERPIAIDAEGYAVGTDDDRLRLFHFHAFDTNAPEELSTRYDGSSAHLREENKAVDELCVDYARELIAYEKALLPAPRYAYGTDTRGRQIARQVRRAYRVASAAGAQLPSPFLPAEADAYERWRRSAWKLVVRELAGDAAKSARLAMPEEYGRLKKKFPQLANKVRSRLIRNQGIWS